MLYLLKERHPRASGVVGSAVLQGPIEAVEKVLFDNIDGGMVYSAAKLRDQLAPLDWSQRGGLECFALSNSNLSLESSVMPWLCLLMNCVLSTLILSTLEVTLPAG